MLPTSPAMAKMGGGDLATHLFARTNFFFFGLVWSTYEEDKTEDEKAIKKSLVHCRLILEITTSKFYRGGCPPPHFCFKIGSPWASEILWRAEPLRDSQTPGVRLADGSKLKLICKRHLQGNDFRSSWRENLIGKGTIPILTESQQICLWSSLVTACYCKGYVFLAISIAVEVFNRNRYKQDW